MNFIVHYWRKNWESVTGIAQGQVIDNDELMLLIHEQKVNVMIHHVKEHNGNPAQSYCYIDDLNHRFQNR